jgi:hypothetical protein
LRGFLLCRNFPPRDPGAEDRASREEARWHCFHPTPRKMPVHLAIIL